MPDPTNVAGSDLILAPITVEISQTLNGKGAQDGYSLTVNVPIPATLMTGVVDGKFGTMGIFSGKRALKMGPDKLKKKMLKKFLGDVKALKDFWTCRYKEIKGLLKDPAP